MRTRFVKSYGGRQDWPDASFGDCGIRALAEVIARLYGTEPSIHHYINTWKIIFDAEREKGNPGMPWDGVHAWDGIWCGPDQVEDTADVVISEPNRLHHSGTMAEVASRHGGFTVSTGVLFDVPSVKLPTLHPSQHKLMDEMSTTRIVWFNSNDLEQPDKHMCAWVDGCLYDIQDPSHMHVMGFTFFKPIASPPQQTTTPDSQGALEPRTEEATP